MVKKRHSDEAFLKLLCEIELILLAGYTVTSVCRSVAIADATLYQKTE